MLPRWKSKYHLKYRNLFSKEQDCTLRSFRAMNVANKRCEESSQVTVDELQVDTSRIKGQIKNDIQQCQERMEELLKRRKLIEEEEEELKIWNSIDYKEN